MARGFYEMRSETQYKLQDMINHARDHQMIEIPRWHAYYIVRDKKLIAIDEYSFKKLKDFTTEDWRRVHAEDWVECREPKMEYYG